MTLDDGAPQSKRVEWLFGAACQLSSALKPGAEAGDVAHACYWFIELVVRLDQHDVWEISDPEGVALSRRRHSDHAPMLPTPIPQYLAWRHRETDPAGQATWIARWEAAAYWLYKAQLEKYDEVDRGALADAIRRHRRKWRNSPQNPGDRTLTGASVGRPPRY
jgi:hypothetical protein